MGWCCPRGHGCNATQGSEPCALEVFAQAADRVPETKLALERWDALEHACEHRRGERERRFRKRAYERARDNALVALALHPIRSGPSRAARRRGSQGVTAAA